MIGTYNGDGRLGAAEVIIAGYANQPVCAAAGINRKLGVEAGTTGVQVDDTGRGRESIPHPRCGNHLAVTGWRRVDSGELSGAGNGAVAIELNGVDAIIVIWCYYFFNADNVFAFYTYI